MKLFKRTAGHRSALFKALDKSAGNVMFAAAAAFLGCATHGVAQQQVESLTLEELNRRVLQRNESVQMKMLEFEIANKRYKGEKGIFEPEWVNSAEYQVNRRENNAEQANSQSGLSVFSEIGRAHV